MKNILNYIQIEFMNSEGRTGRKKYFFNMLGLIIVSIVSFLFVGWLSVIFSNKIIVYIFLFFFVSTELFATLNLRAKRFHDMGCTGWWQLIIGIPIIGLILELILLFYPGTNGVNKYGHVPLRKSKKSND